ncbi:MAG: twin-arginine translocation signal domain-containing protein [Candidatus Acetothermia bacterium]|nr:twin-arginine translocation signal domain-containing protein [Candidatus Acetothermia bacterium]MDH7505097.1 twin-arginine translocation signal domain-containing protein [Candidatus Acetothermia bacterium]
MEKLTRRQFLKASGLLGLGAVLGLQSCDALWNPGPSEPLLSFAQLGSSCASVAEGAELQGGRGRITFSGAVSTPTPCYDLTAELITMRCGPGERCVNTYEIAITSKAQEGYCIECLGSVSYRGELRRLNPGVYNIGITHDGRLITAAQVQVD